MILIFIVYSICDFTITSMNINHNSFYELNPIARYVINNYGIFGLALLKIILSIPFIIIYGLFHKRISKWAEILCKITIYSLILFWCICWGNFLWLNL